MHSLGASRPENGWSVFLLVSSLHLWALVLGLEARGGYLVTYSSTLNSCGQQPESRGLFLPAVGGLMGAGACCGGLDESSHSLPPPLSLLSNAHHQCTQTTLLRSDSVQSIALFCSATKCIAIFNSAYSAVPSVALSWKTTQDHSRWKRHCNASRTRNQSLDGNEWRWWDWHQILEEPDTEQSKNTSGPTKHSFLLRKKNLFPTNGKTHCV